METLLRVVTYSRPRNIAEVDKLSAVQVEQPSRIASHLNAAPHRQPFSKILAVTGVDASVELVKELDRLSGTSLVARHAPRSKALYTYLARGIQGQDAAGLSRTEYLRITLGLIEKLGVWWSPEAFRRLPVMVPWCVRDRSCRYDQGPESWGAPRADAYLRDDNSIIKKLPLTCLISAPPNHPYRDRKPWRGFTACHIWRHMSDGTLAGADPWLYSFMPNLIWLPSWIAPLTDRQMSEVQQTLQRTSLSLFGSVTVPRCLTTYTEYAWARLESPPDGPELSTDQLAKFAPSESFFSRRVTYLGKFVAGCESVLAGAGLTSKLICSRYTAGLPRLDTDAIAAFRVAISDYRDAVEAALD